MICHPLLTICIFIVTLLASINLSFIAHFIAELSLGPSWAIVGLILILWVKLKIHVFVFTDIGKLLQLSDLPSWSGKVCQRGRGNGWKTNAKRKFHVLILDLVPAWDLKLKFLGGAPPQVLAFSVWLSGCPSVRLSGCLFVPTLQMSTFQAQYGLGPKSKAVVAMIRPQNIFNLNPISHGGHSTLFWSIDFLDETFLAQYGLDLKGKVVSDYDQTPKIFLDLNPISHGGHLTLFWQHSHFIKYLDLKIKVVGLNGQTLEIYSDTVFGAINPYFSLLATQTS